MKKVIIAAAVAALFVSGMADARRSSSSFRSYSKPAATFKSPSVKISKPAKTYEPAKKTTTQTAAKKENNSTSRISNSNAGSSISNASNGSSMMSNAAVVAAIAGGLFLINSNGNIEVNGVEYGDLDDLCSLVTDDAEVIEVCDAID